MMPSERVSEEQIDTNFSFIAPSSEELCVQKDSICTSGKGRHTYMYIYCSVCKYFHTFSP